MPVIKYQGFTPVVLVPTYGLSDVAWGEEITVSEAIATDLTQDGTSEAWVVVV